MYGKMFIQVLKSKLKKVKVTAADTEYEGSLTLDPDLMEAAKLIPYERVEVNAVYGTDRLVTYVIPGKRGSGQVEMNGGMANFFKPGDWIHVNCFTFADDFYLDREEKVVLTFKTYQFNDEKGRVEMTGEYLVKPTELLDYWSGKGQIYLHDVEANRERSTKELLRESVRGITKSYNIRAAS